MNDRSTRIRRTFVILGIGVASTAASMVVVQPASAGLSSCSGAEQFCIWENVNYGGDMYANTAASTDWQYNSYGLPNTAGYAVRNDDTAYKSRWDVPVTVYRDNNYGRAYHCLVPGQAVSYAGAFPAQDDGQSHKWKGGSTC